MTPGELAQQQLDKLFGSHATSTTAPTLKPEPTDHAKLAVDLGRQGFWLVGIDPADKKPKQAGWSEKDRQPNGLPLVGGRDEKTLLEIFDGPNPPDIGMLTWCFGPEGQGSLLGVDLDGPEGEASWLNLRKKHDAAELATTGQQTRRGRHLIYVLRNRRGVRTQAGDLGEGLDIRSAANGYLKVHGSGPDAVPMVDAPDWLIAACGAAKEKTTAKPTIPAVDLTDPAIQARMRYHIRHYLAVDAPLAKLGSGSDTVVRKVAPMCWDYGATEDQALELLYERRPEVNDGRSWSDRCLPPWDDADQLMTFVAHGFEYCTTTAQGSRLVSDFAVPAEPMATAKKPRLYYEFIHALSPPDTRPALVEGTIELGTLCLLYGKPGEKKTFLALSLAYAIASGTPWLTREVQQGLVIYVACEGGGGIRKRFEALRRYHGTAADAALLVLVPCMVNLAGAGSDVQPLLELIQQICQESGQRAPILIIVDTLARAIAGGNENAPEVMGQLILNVDKIRTATGAAVLLVHHPGKDTTKGARGHSNLYGAVDTEFEIADGRIRFTKQKDLDEGPPIGFRTQSVAVGQDARGREMTSLIVLPHDLTAAKDFPQAPIKTGSVPGRALAVLADMTPTGGEDRKVLLGSWKDRFVATHYIGKKRGTAWAAFHDAVSKLREAGRISIEGDYATYTE